MNPPAKNIRDLFIEKSKALGFNAIGFSKAEVLDEESARLRSWLNSGYDADMKWIDKGFEKRKDVKLILPDAKSVISLAFNYYTPIEHDPSKPKISRYAWGKDYHKILKGKLKELIRSIEQTSPRTYGALPLLGKEGTENPLPLSGGDVRRTEGVAMKYYVDDGPVMDKSWAVRAGIGWMGKHTNVISPDFGSWFFICSIITNIEFDSYDSPVTDQCGSCTLCISACPTGAIIDEYKLDSNLCISYHTIENRGEIPESIDLDGWIFGCDVCQDVCPYNAPKYNTTTSEEAFYPKEELFKDGVWKSKKELEEITEEEFASAFADSPVKRTKYSGWKRNLDNFPM